MTMIIGSRLGKSEREINDTFTLQEIVDYVAFFELERNGFKLPDDHYLTDAEKAQKLADEQKRKAAITKARLTTMFGPPKKRKKNG